MTDVCKICGHPVHECVADASQISWDDPPFYSWIHAAELWDVKDPIGFADSLDRDHEAEIDG